MRVLLASFDNPATLSGGVEFYTAHLAAALHRAGADVRVVTRTPVPPEAWWRGVSLPGPWGLPTHRHRLLVDGRFDRAVRQAAAWADVVHGQNLDGRGALGTTPVVATVHTTPVDEWESSRLGGWRERVYQRHMHARRERAWQQDLPRHARVWTVGQAIAASARRLGVTEPQVIENAVSPLPIGDRDGTRARFRLEGPTALFIGRFAAVKGVERLVDAVEAMEDWNLIIAGAGPQASEIARRVHGRPRMHLLGRVEDQEKAGLLAAADVFCLPSEHEGQPLSLLEAMAAGVPVVATKPWVPPRLRGFGRWGRDLPALLEEARAMPRRRAPVKSYDDLARDYLAGYP